MKRLFLAFLSVFMMTACSSAPASEGSQKEEAPAEEEMQEQAETPAEETSEETSEESGMQGAIYGIADTTYVSFEIDELNWTMMPGDDLNNVAYTFSSGSGKIQVYTRPKTESYDTRGLNADASFTDYTDSLKYTFESDPQEECTEFADKEIDGHTGVLYTLKFTDDNGTVFWSKSFVTLIDDTDLVSISLEAMGEEDFNACKDAFEHALSTMYFHEALR